MRGTLQQRIAALKADRQKRAESRALVENICVSDHIAPVYIPLHEDIQSNAHKYYNLPGGRGSGKSSTVSLEIVDGISKDSTGMSNAIIFRRTAATMRESVYSQIMWAINTLGLSGLWRGCVSPMSFTYIPTGAQIIFRGLDDSTKLKSIKPKRGTFKYVWFEEFSELPGENFTRSVMQSVVRGGKDFVVFRTFNPPLSKNNWANVFVSQYDPRALTLRTSYLDMPTEWLGEDFIYEAERLKAVNPRAYEHEYMGEAIGSGGEVFPNITVREIPDSEAQQLQYIYCGIDFGFAVDPVCFVRAAYDSKTDTVYVLDEIYRRHMSNKQLAEEIKARGYDKSLDPAYVSYFGSPGGRLEQPRQYIVCDCAEPKSINDLQGEGLKVSGCKKFPGCVEYRIKWLQNRQIVIDPQRTPNVHREFVSYEYMQTKDGEFLADVPDKDNHSIDALAYALDRLIYKKGLTA